MEIKSCINEYTKSKGPQRKNTLPKLPGVYRILNIISGDSYIGSTGNLHKRFEQHLEYLRHRLTKAKNYQKLAESFQKYGESSFIFEVLIFCEEFERTYYEKEFIRILQPNCNTSYTKELIIFRRKNLVVISPKGDLLFVKDINLKDFCTNNNLDYNVIRQLPIGVGYKYSGWQIL